MSVEPSSPYRLGHYAFIGYLSFLSTFVPLSTDLYLPALPSMVHYFETSPELVNISLSGFMLVFALSMLLWGPLSDKYGRKPLLYVGFSLYILSSIGTALSSSVYQLIVGRCIQALGSGAVSAVCMAIVKDSFKGRRMENVLASMQTLMVLAPILAPILGGVLLSVTSWRGLFWALAFCGLVAVMGSFALRETLSTPLKSSALHSLTRIGFVLRNRGFRLLLITFSVFSMPFMAYLAVSAYVFQTIFQVSPQTFSYFFAGNAMFSMLGPLLYVRFLRDFPKRTFLACCFGGSLAAGAGLLFFGAQSPFLFAAFYMVITFCGSAVRPSGAMLMMQQLDTDNGTVSSLIGSTAILFGSFSMMLCSFAWASFITTAAIITMLASAASLGSWIFVNASQAYKQV